MPPTTKKSVLAGHFGAAPDLAKKVAQDTTLPSAGFQDPPPGIKASEGRAQFDEVKFDVFKQGDNEGKPYAMFTGVILEPEEFTYMPTMKGKVIEGAEPITVKTAGMQTRIMINMHDQQIKSGPKMGQTKTKEDCALEVAAHMRALGADTSKIRQISDLEDIAENLTNFARDKSTPIYFSFSTSVRKAQNQGMPDSGCWQNWHGTQGLESYSPPDEGAGTIDNSGPANDVDLSSQENSDGADPTTNSDDDNPLTGETLEALLEVAEKEEGDDTPAQNELLRRASETSGWTVEDLVANLSAWGDLVAIANGEEPPAEEPEAPSWKKGDHAHYTPMKKGIGGRMVKEKKVECQLTTVNEAKGTATLKNTVDGRTVYKDVPLTELEEIK